MKGWTVAPEVQARNKDVQSLVVKEIKENITTTNPEKVMYVAAYGAFKTTWKCDLIIERLSNSELQI